MNSRSESSLQIFLIFLRLGLTSFGGPVAHLGYFREAFVERRRWLSEHDYADLVALCQLLSGPASSQVGMALGLQRGGYAGLAAAWLGFTLPSAVLLILAALGLSLLESAAFSALVAGLKLVAVVVVAQALLGMYRGLVKTRVQQLLMLLSCALILLWGGVWLQLLVIATGALCGYLWGAAEVGRAAAPAPGTSVTLRASILWLALFTLGLLGLPVLALSSGSDFWILFDGLYRSGALVFGGGHVVLPLLQQEVVGVGLVDEGAFLAGYGLAQAVPGPLFTLASFLGADAGVAQAVLPESVSGVSSGSVWLGILWGLAATLAIFLPAFLLLVGVMPHWQRLKTYAGVRRALSGVNAAVVGLLLAALCNPVISSAVTGGPQALVVAVLGVLVWKKLPVVWLVLCGAGSGLLLSQLG